jgi:cyclopropane-fatty-acyl-phospholipid synthase
MNKSAASTLEPVVRRMLGGQLPVRVQFWDDSTLGPPSSDSTIVLRSPQALRHMLWAPGELGFGRAYVAGDLDVEGDIFRTLDLRELMGGLHDNVEVKLDARGLGALAKATTQLGVIGKPPGAPIEEARLRGRLHTRARDEAAVAHHYNVGNRFYEKVLGPTMAYSCAYWADTDFTLEDAQAAKFELVCRKLGLREGDRLLDVGCGWGSMLIHAARHHGVHGVGITLAKEQAVLARERVREAGLDDKIEIRFQDYRETDDGPYDAISSIGMFEHVGEKGMHAYFTNLHELLKPHGRILNHAISRPNTNGGRLPPRSFVARYVFPDGELMEVGTVVTAMQDLGLEVRDVESLREHYARTLRAWVENLENNWDDIVADVGAGRARVWRLYMAASAVGFETNRIAIHQVLGVKPDEHGRSGVESTRARLRIDQPLPQQLQRVT